MKPGSPGIALAAEPIGKWQRLIDLVANVVQVPSAVVCKLESPDDTHYSVLVANASEANPFPVGDRFAMDIGTFCETVIKSRNTLLVVNALEDDRWKSAPETKVGMVSYLGLPVAWPDGRMFGTICVLDDKANAYSNVYQDFLVHCRDILEGDLAAFVHANEQLKNQKAHFAELFARVPEAVVLINHEHRIDRINPEFTRVFGYAEEEALGQEIGELLTASGREQDVAILLSQMLGAKEAFALETTLSRKDGTCVPVAATCVPISSIDGEALGYLIFRDMTEAKHHEDEQRRYQEIQLELAQLNRNATLAQLSASIAHELNQPLAGIVANCATCLQLLTGSAQDLEAVREAVRRTKRDSDRASEVVQRLRALFTHKKPSFEEVNLNDAVCDVLALSLGDLENGKVILRTELAEEVPCVWADRIQLQQVILNLILNAMDAMEVVDNRPRDLLIKTQLDENGWVNLLVKDVGVGFDPDEVNKLFEAFYSTKVGGMGVGLAVSRSIIDNHRGRLCASSNHEFGATFSFSLPSEQLIRPQ